MRVRNLAAFLTPTLLLLGLVWLAPTAFAAANSTHSRPRAYAPPDGLFRDSGMQPVG